MDNRKKTERLINAIGTTAESSLIFYRAAVNIAAMAFGKGQAQNTAAQQEEGKQT